MLNRYLVGFSFVDGVNQIAMHGKFPTDEYITDCYYTCYDKVNKKVIKYHIDFLNGEVKENDE